MSAANTERLKDEGSKLQVVVAGATAGMIARFVIAPLDVVKIRLQLQTHSLSDSLSQRAELLRGGPVYKGTLSTMRHIVRHEGITGLWKGNVPAELLYITYSAVQFTSYRSAAQLLHRVVGEDRQLPAAAESFVAGAAAGIASTTVTYPLDLLRTRFAAQGSGDDRVYPSLRRALADIWRDEGYRGFFRGLGPAVGQTFPFMGIFFAAYESLRAPLADLKLPFWGGQLALASMTASALAKTAVFPLDLVRRRIQVQGPTRSKYVHKNIPEYKGTFSTISTIIRTEGIRGLYRGLTVSLIKSAPASAVTMWTYEKVLRALITLQSEKHD
ncbi:hypothetical protein PpBr36_08680 [Pyricularia pennisetigena]|uniref:hypothetical protein n=1 Tax=Pyricularia pennisetigena TaxID=1578925 RepID=UPI001150A4E0|nr:hypothetical protein PpBr36_08680 [Pyricularia pennisetigena]TLS24699.1 hypothetical protein PpBr36_08680 [Pyricularia pennisetigena]